MFKLSAMQKEMDTLNLLYERQREQYQVARQNVQIDQQALPRAERFRLAALRQMSERPADPEPESPTVDEAEKAARALRRQPKHRQ